ncbi:MAG: hypothetical protein WAX04_10445 [Oscillospiraceae bacterium]
MSIFKSYSFRKFDEEGKVVKPKPTTLRWPMYYRMKVYKKIALMVLADKTGYTNDTMLSFQDIVNVCCAKKINYHFDELATELKDEHEIVDFIQLFPKDLHPAIMDYVQNQKRLNRGYSMNTFTLQAIDEYIDEI